MGTRTCPVLGVCAGPPGCAALARRYAGHSEAPARARQPEPGWTDRCYGGDCPGALPGSLGAHESLYADYSWSLCMARREAGDAPQGVPVDAVGTATPNIVTVAAYAACRAESSRGCSAQEGRGYARARLDVDGGPCSRCTPSRQSTQREPRSFCGSPHGQRRAEHVAERGQTRFTERDAAALPRRALRRPAHGAHDRAHAAHCRRFGRCAAHTGACAERRGRRACLGERRVSAHAHAD